MGIFKFLKMSMMKIRKDVDELIEILKRGKDGSTISNTT